MPDSDRCRVLVVDDNIDAAPSLMALFGLSGHRVRMAHDGTDAVTAAIACRPDGVLLEIGLPGLDGFEVAKRIRLKASLKHIVLVALTLPRWRGFWRASRRQRISCQVALATHLSCRA